MMNVDSFEGVADSTDWLPTPLSGLCAVEAALRCQICKDFYKTPMLTSCNHTFCSLCIRRSLSADGKCPLCRASEQEMKLRSNWSMEEVVTAFVQTRSLVLDFACRPTAAARAETPKRKAGDMESDDAIVEAGSEQQQSASQQPPSKRLRSSARLSKTRGMETTADMARREAHVPDLEFEPEPEPKPAKVEPNDGLVACPICLRRMKEQLVDRHIDTSCPGEPQPDPTPPPAQPSRRSPSKPISIAGAFAPSTSTSTSTSTALSSTLSRKPQPAPDRLPALNYSMLKETQLRKELGYLGLSTSGSRAMLERRHREWVMIWNANCDSQRPRPRAELLRELEVWERTFGSRAPTGSRAATVGAQIRDKDFDGAAWAAKHGGTFQDLIADARRTRARTQAAPADEGGNTNTADGVPVSEEAAHGTAESTAKSDKPEIIGAKPMVVDLVNSPP
ncbi:DNA repair protein rad18 [Nemania sp. NC0429]|nr:DNA repair protein rad18 [Nemania sp. NC0429]